MRNSSASERRAGGPWLWLFAASSGGTVALALGLALAHSVGVLSWPRSDAFDFSGWQALLHGHAFWQSLGYSLALTMVSLALALALALALLIALGERVRSGLLGRVLYLPLAVPGVVAALLAFVLLGDSGLLARWAHALGLIVAPAEFPALIFDRKGRGIILTHLAMITPLFVLLFERLATHTQLPLLLRHAETLGATRGQAWRRVGLPLLLRQAQPVIAVYGVVLLGAFEVPLLIGAAQPSLISVTIQRALSGYALTARPFGYAMASLYLMLLIAGWAGLSWRSLRAEVKV